MGWIPFLLTHAWLRWDPVVTNCQGGPEVVLGYAILVMAVWVSGWYECEPGIQCPVYARSPWLQVEFTDQTGIDLMAQPVPPVGGVDIYRPVAVDQAGNTSEDPCP
jgi:hypothetical protein